MSEFDRAQFLEEDWQARPRLFRDFIVIEDPVSAEELAGLALESEIESRVVRVDAPDKWTQTLGPFDESFFLSLPESDWTLLVQAVDLWLPQVASVYERFDFLPRWRFDDVMVSYATQGGGVGPHYDFYDVFLIQVTGHRRWHLGQLCNESSALVTDGGMRTLADFQLKETIETEPGDVLYVPPLIAHWGESIDASMTYSVGLRRPTAQEVLYDLAIELEARGSTRYLTDAKRSVVKDPLEIVNEDIQAIQHLLQEAIRDDALIGDWLARYMSYPKYDDLIEMTNEVRLARFNGVTYRNGVPDE